MNLKAKGRFCLIFFKSTLLISIAAGLAITFVGFSQVFKMTLEASLFLMLIGSVLRVTCFVGLPLSLIYKEWAKKYEYYFYYNAGLSKINLIVATYVLYIFSSILIYSICHIIWNLIF